MDKWTIAEVSNASGGKGIFRYLQAKPAKWETLTEEVSLSWNYEGAFPDEETKLKMDALEDALDSQFSGDICLALVMTVGGLREWCFYAKNYENFMEQLNQGLAGKPRFPISIVHSPDPDWEYWHSFVDKIEQKEKKN